MHLAFVRGYDTGVDAFRQYPFLAYLLEIGFQDVQGEPCLLGIGAAGTVRIAGFSEVGYLNRRESRCTHRAGRGFRQVWGSLFLVCRVYPFHWRVPVQNAPVFHFRGTFHLSVVEAFAGEAHDGIVHAVLRAEQADRRRMPGGNGFHQRAVQSALQGLGTFHGGRKLAMVAGQDDASGLLDGNPAGGFERLGGFVDEQGREFLTGQYAVGTACQRAGNDPRFVEQAFVDGDFQFGSPVAQAGYLLVKGFTARRRAAGVQVADGFADGPKGGVKRMCFETPFVGERQHLVIHARRVAHAQHSHTPVGQFLRNPVYGHVALGAYQYLGFTM